MRHHQGTRTSAIAADRASSRIAVTRQSHPGRFRGDALCTIAQAVSAETSGLCRVSRWDGHSVTGDGDRRAAAPIWWSSGRCMVRSVSRSAAGLAPKRPPAPGQAAGTVDLPGVRATAGRGRVRLRGALAVQRLAELALDLFLGNLRLRGGVRHADLLQGRPYPQLRTRDTGMPPARMTGSSRRRRRTHCHAADRTHAYRGDGLDGDLGSAEAVYSDQYPVPMPGASCLALNFWRCGEEPGSRALARFCDGSVMERDGTAGVAGGTPGG